MKAKFHPQAVNQCSKTYSCKVHREGNRAGRDLTRAEKRLQNLKGRKQRVRSKLQKFPSAWLPGRERDARGGEGAAAPVTRRPSDRGRPRPRPPRGLGSRRHQPGAWAWGRRGSLSAAPETRAERRGRGPSQGAALPRTLPSGSGQRGPSPQAESPTAETGAHGAAQPSRHHRLRGPGAVPREAARPPRTHRASPAAGTALLSLLPPPPLLRGSWGGRTGRWDCAGSSVVGQGRARSGRGSHGGPASGRGALTGPGAPGRADRGGERGCGLRWGAGKTRPRAEGGREVPAEGAAWEPRGGAGEGPDAPAAARGGLFIF